MPLVAPDPIESPRLRIRALARADLPALLKVNGDEQVTRFLPYATWASLADGEAWFERMQGLQAPGTALQLVIADRVSDAAIGTCLLFRLEAASARAELGYVLGRAHWGQGLMFEALTALLADAFGPMALRRLEAEINPLNLPSARVLRRVGFVREGLLRQRWVNKGATTDSEVFGLLREEWSGAPSP